MRLGKSLKEFGDLSGVVKNNTTGNLVGGHQRLKFLKDSPPVIEKRFETPTRTGTVATGYIEFECERFVYREVEWGEHKEKAGMIAANNQGGENDFIKMSEILLELDEINLDMDLTGFGSDEIEDIMTYSPNADKYGDQDADQVPESRITDIKNGGLFLLGNHRLMCGDSTNREDIKILMNGEKADITFTSPPYNAAKFEVTGTARRGKSDVRSEKYLNNSDDMTEEEYEIFISNLVEIYCEHSTSVMINIGILEPNKRAVYRVISKFVDKFKDTVYWRKSTSTPHIQPGIMTTLVEPIFCFGSHNSRQFKHANFRGNFGNIIEGENASGNEFAKIHAATFPVYLPVKIIEAFVSIGGAVIDCFMGTGTTLIACEKTNRKCFGMEIDPQYVQVIIDRWEKFTGQKAVKVES